MPARNTGGQQAGGFILGRGHSRQRPKVNRDMKMDPPLPIGLACQRWSQIGGGKACVSPHLVQVSGIRQAAKPLPEGVWVLHLPIDPQGGADLQFGDGD